MLAPERFAAWMCTHVANDHKFGRKLFRYHPRSDTHSKTLCRFVFEDLLEACSTLAAQVHRGEVVGVINAEFTFPNGKTKTLDLAIGEPAELITPSSPGDDPTVRALLRLRLSCEAKQCMTEHSKTKPRIFDELSSSHEIVHQGDTNAIAAGIVVVNIADEYASPTRQVSAEGELIKVKHRQPQVTESMIRHLEGLVMREGPGTVGFDAFATIVVNCDNIGACGLHTAPPAPQPGSKHHYGTFLRRLSEAYARHYGG